MSRKQLHRPPQQLILTRARLWAIAALGVVWAIFSPSIGTAILPPDAIGDWWHNLWRSDAERVVEDYVARIDTAAPWVHPPTTYKDSVAYFKEHYADLDPTRGHDHRPDFRRTLTLPQLATEAAGWTGQPVMLSADVGQPPSLVEPMSNAVGSFEVSLADRLAPGARVLCRLPFKRPLPYVSEDRITTTGLILAEGTAERPNGRGMERVIYMACTSMVRSANITLTPRPDPRTGRKPKTAVLEINE